MSGLGYRVAGLDRTGAARNLLSDPAVPFIVGALAVASGMAGGSGLLVWAGAAALAGYSLSGST